MSEGTPTPTKNTPAQSAPAVATLQKAAAGLLFPSETDAPLEPFFWPAEKAPALTPDQVAQLASAPAEAAIKTVKLDTFFRPATTEEGWHNKEEKAQVQRFQELVNTIKDTLEEVKVYRVGETSVDVYIVGQVEGGYAGLKTKVVET